MSSSGLLVICLLCPWLPSPLLHRCTDILIPSCFDVASSFFFRCHFLRPSFLHHHVLFLFLTSSLLLHIVREHMSFDPFMHHSQSIATVGFGYPGGKYFLCIFLAKRNPDPSRFRGHHFCYCWGGAVSRLWTQGGGRLYHGDHSRVLAHVGCVWLFFSRRCTQLCLLLLCSQIGADAR